MLPRIYIAIPHTTLCLVCECYWGLNAQQLADMIKVIKEEASNDALIDSFIRGCTGVHSWGSATKSVDDGFGLFEFVDVYCVRSFTQYTYTKPSVCR